MLSIENKDSIYVKVKGVLAVASQLIIASAVKLPPKVVTVAHYVVLLLGILEAVEGAAKQTGGDDESE